MRRRRCGRSSGSGSWRTRADLEVCPTRPRGLPHYLTTTLSVAWLSQSSSTRTASVCSPGAMWSSVKSYDNSCESESPVTGATSVQSPPSSEYSAFLMSLSASAALQVACSLPPDSLAARLAIRGGVLSIRNGSLTIEVESASAGGLPGRSDAVTRKRYSPSGNAVESQLQYFSLTLSLRSFQFVSCTPRISTVKIRLSPFSSEAAQRAPVKPLAYCMEGVPESSNGDAPGLEAGLPIGGSVSVCEGMSRIAGAGNL